MIYPKITIVTPNFNYGHFLEQTIQSVLSQNYPNLEYIIIDGGSTDNSVEVIKRYEKHLAYWCSEKDGGMYDAINKGFRRSNGEIMAWLNSDDVYLPWALQTVAEVFSVHPHIKWVSSLQPGLIDYYGKVLSFGVFRGFSASAFADGRYIPEVNSYGAIQQESTFWTRSLWKAAGEQVSCEFPLAGDFELWAKFFSREKLFGIISPLGCFRVHHQQKTTLKSKYIGECQEILSAYRSQLPSPDRLKQFLLRTRLNNIPALGWRIGRRLGYRATNVIRRPQDSSLSVWCQEDVIFL